MRARTGTVWVGMAYIGAGMVIKQFPGMVAKRAGLGIQGWEYGGQASGHNNIFSYVSQVSTLNAFVVCIEKM